MNILEAKLNSIPNLDGSAANATTAATTGNNTPAPASTHGIRSVLLHSLPPQREKRRERCVH